ncbi:Fc.00g041610.m01.CDS01 [Cosmosporella sp. VM-42]
MSSTTDKMRDIRQLIKQSPPVDVSEPYDPSTLEDKTILITGGANGLGAHMVRQWASHGAHIVIGDVADKAGEQLVASLRMEYPKAIFEFQHCDVTDWESQVALFETAVKVSPHGVIDVVVPNAGIILPGESMKFEYPSLENGKLPEPNTATIDVNIKGCIFTTHLALYHLPRSTRPDRCILLIGSLSSICPFPGQGQYTMTKHAVLGLFRTLRSTAFTNGIRVNMIAPYYTAQTNMLKPAVEALFLSGSAGPARIPDVIDAATRLIADESVAGRALAIGPRMKSRGIERVEEDERMVVGDAEGDGEGRGVWECYAEDYDEVDTFVHRYVWLLNGVAKARGTFAWIGDLWRMLTRS